MEKHGFNLPLILTQFLADHFPDKESRSSLSVYEAGVGTGRLAEVMVKAGFSNISGIEPCEAMIKEAEKKKLYSTLKVRYCGTGDLEEEWKGKFDIAAGCGIFMGNCAPPKGMDELLDAVKKGGVVVFSSREDEWVELGYKDKAESLEKEGKWKLEKEVYDLDSAVGKRYVCSCFMKL